MKLSLTILTIFWSFISAVSVWPESLPGPYNAITDVPGLEVGHYAEKPFLTGATVILAKQGAVGAVNVSPVGTRETDLLNPINLVEKGPCYCA